MRGLVTPRERGSRRPLRAAAMILVVAGAAASLALTLQTGRHNNSRLLLTLFAVWVLSPFIALLLAGAASKRWPVPRRATLYGVMLAIAVGSVAVYGVVALGPPRAKPAFVFLVVPLASWLVMVVASVSAFLSDGSSRR